MNYELSVLIPARNEIFLARTIEDVLKHSSDRTEVIVGLDGEWADPVIADHPRVTIVHVSEPLGQRAMTNQLCRLSKAKYIMKLDAHCALDEGFDVKMLEAFQEAGDDVTMIPVMRNLHAFNWVCPNGHSRYQGPSGVCTECGEETTRDVVWIAKPNPQSTAFRFDTTMHFQYWNEWGKEQTGDLTETLSIQGSCFMLTRKKYWELDICSEEFHSWGQQGVEVACKTWLSGGRVLVNRKTWYAHMFRTQGGDFSFPYENPQSKVDANRELSRQLFQHDGWDKAKLPFSWLLKKFNPPEWEIVPTKGILYYTDNQLNMKIARSVRRHLSSSGLPITSVSLKKMDFGTNYHLHLKRGKLTMFKQILKGLEEMKEDIVFLCEADVIYHKSHFDFTPPRNDIFYYNENNWRVRASDGHAVYYDHDATSQCCAYRELLLEEYRERVRRVEAEGFHGNGYEPGTRPISKGGFSDRTSERWRSAEPNIDIRHDNNLTESRWSQDKFRNKQTCTNWREDNIKNLWVKQIF